MSVDAEVVDQVASTGADAVSRHVPGEPGLWVLLFGDMTVFAVLFGVYLTKRGASPGIFEQSQHTLNRDLGAVNTVLLLCSSILVVAATRALRGGLPELAPRLVLAAMGCGLGFVAVKAFEYHEKLAAGITPTTNSFYTYYFVLTGVHLAHLVVGLLVLAVLWRLTRKPMTSTGSMVFECGACFWHMVDLLWMVIFPLVFLVR